MCESSLIVDYHKTRSKLDVNFIVSIFDRDESDYLKELQRIYQHSIIRLKNCVTYGGSVPFNHNGSVVTVLGSGKIIETDNA